MRDPEAVSGAGGSQASRQHIINLSPCMFNIRLSESDVILSPAPAQYPAQTVFIDSHKSFDYSSDVLTLTHERNFHFSYQDIFYLLHIKYANVSRFRFINHVKCAPFKSLSKRNAEKV